MPELPDITVYLDALESRLNGQRLRDIKFRNPFLLRTVEPRPEDLVGDLLVAFQRLGKRIAMGFESDKWLVIHLMIAGRLQWSETGKKSPRGALVELYFDHGVLSMTEAGSKRRASVHIVSGTEALAEHHPPGIEIADTNLSEFKISLTRSNHTLKRALTDPKLFSGIGNAYSDEILHRAKLSPILQTQKMTDPEITRLFEACRGALAEWTEHLRHHYGDRFPTKVTAFREGMAVHGRFGEPCPECGTEVQRIRYAANEVNYCPRCQTGGKVLADRALSRLLKKDWPRTIEELEANR